MIVLRLLRHRERSRHRDLDAPVRDRTQELDVPHLDRSCAMNRAHHTRHRVRMTGSIQRNAGGVQVDTVEGGREPVGVALATHLAVRDDVDARTLHVRHRDPGRIVLCLLEVRLRDAPELAGSHSRRQPRPQPLSIDQPVGLRIAPDHGRYESVTHRVRTYRRAEASCSRPMRVRARFRSIVAPLGPA